jgi:pSer/pThr/pTyr-binding forkhead associated (FHA) protein
MAYLETGGNRVTVPVGELHIGSDPAGPLVLPGATVHAVHAIVQGYADGQVAIRRAVAEAETKVNGVRLGPQPTPLLHGDKVQIGVHELRFVDERRSGSTQYVQAVDPAILAAGGKPAAGRPREATAGTGGRIVSLTDGREYAIAGASMVFGRDAGCDVVITDKNVSRRHAEIMATPKGYVLVDSSTNGTFVGGERVQGQRLLARADVIRIGNDEFRFYADRAPAAPPAPAQAAPAPAPAPPAPAPAPAPRAPGQAAPRAPSPAQAPPRPPAAAARPADAPAPSPAVPLPPRGAAQRLADTSMGVPGMPRPGAAPAAAKPKAPPGVLANLLVRSGALKGQRLSIRVPIVNVGRAEYNDLVLPDESVSTTHAKLQRREGVWVLVDLDSTNGCFVDAERVQGETPLAPGALIRLGDVQVLFEPTDDAVDAAKGSSTKLMSAVKLPGRDPSSPR